MAVIGMYPDAELVISAWVKSIPGIQIDSADDQLPWDLAVNPGVNGYVQVTVLNGAPDPNVPLFHTVAQIDCWTMAPSEDRIFRLRASSVAKQIQYAAYDRKNAERGLTLLEQFPDGNYISYPNAHMYTVECLSEPHKIQSRVNPIYEGYSMDMMFNWTAGITVA